MSKDTIRAAALLSVVAAASGAIGYWIARPASNPPSHASASSDGAATGLGDRKVLYWYDPMVPSQHFDKPGKSPFMDMPLVARYANEDTDAGSVRIDPGMAQNLGIRLATVERGTLANTMDAAATVELNDRNVAIVQSRSAGFVERVYARAPGDVIASGAPLVDLLVPEWAGAQSEFLALVGIGDPTLAQAARERLKLLGMPQDMIDAVEITGKTQAIVTISAPIGGLIKALDVRAGMNVAAGASLARINGLDTVWLEAAIPEAQAGPIVAGQRVRASLAAYPGKSFDGTVIAVLPEANPESRTLRVRVELRNHDGRLKPGMYAQLHLDVGAGMAGLLIPSEAVIRTGSRNVVFLALPQGRYRPVEIRLGPESDGKVIVMDGITTGQKIVSSGQFLIDSEAGFRGVLARLEPATGNVAAKTAVYEAVGTVESIQDGKVTLSHGPVEALGWGSMTMTFGVARPEMVTALKPGERVRFEFGKGEDGYVIETLKKVAGQP